MAGQHLPTLPRRKSARLSTLSTREALNASGSGGQWTVNTAATHGGTATTDTIHVGVGDASQLGIYAAGDIYFNFSTTTTDCNTSNDLRIPGSTLTFITVPLGLGETIYFSHLGVAACAVRIVEI